MRGRLFSALGSRVSQSAGSGAGGGREGLLRVAPPRSGRLSPGVSVGEKVRGEGRGPGETGVIAGGGPQSSGAAAAPEASRAVLKAAAGAGARCAVGRSAARAKLLLTAAQGTGAPPPRPTARWAELGSCSSGERGCPSPPPPARVLRVWLAGTSPPHRLHRLARQATQPYGDARL